MRFARAVVLRDRNVGVQNVRGPRRSSATRFQEDPIFGPVLSRNRRNSRT